nr:protein MAINTENANCE OF MERISTEMS-like [Arachis hypogaea]
MVNVLIKKWHLSTHTFYLPVSECAVTLEDVAVILGLLTNGLSVTGVTMSNHEALEAECLHQFGVAPRKDKSGTAVHLKFLPLLRDFGSIGQYSWGSACLAYMYRALGRASRFDCKKIDGPLTLLLDWIWIRLPFIAPIPRELHNFRLKTADRFRRQFDFIQGVSHQERNLDKAHGEVLTAPKNLDCTKYDNHLNLLDLVVQENDEDNLVSDEDNPISDYDN